MLTLQKWKKKGKSFKKECDRLTAKVNVLKEDAVFFEDAIAFQDFGLYTPRYNFLTAEEYKLRLVSNPRPSESNDQILMPLYLVLCDWTVDGSKSKGTKLINDMKKLFLRAFNSECEDAITKVGTQ